jgi:hypothetical protein
LAGTDPEFHTTSIENDLELKEVVDERKWHRMAKTHDILEILQGS